MKLPDPLIIGSARRGSPQVYGWWRYHLLGERLIGEKIIIRDQVFVIDVSYVPDNPKKEKLVPILSPLYLPINPFIWFTLGFKKNREKDNQEPPKEEEYPF